MKRGRYFLLFTLLAFLASAVFTSDAMATADPSGDFTGLLDLIHRNSNNWFVSLKGYATNIFWMLALIQLVWTFFPLVFKQADFGEIAGELIRFFIVIGFFYLLLEKSQEYAGDIVNSFRQAGSTAAGLGTTDLMPGDVFDMAVEMALLIGSVGTLNPLTTFMLSLAGLVVLLGFTFIAAFIGLTIIESYIVINASVLFMGFGGSTWTRGYSVAMLRYAVAVGTKLFILTLLVGLVIQSAHQWQRAYDNSDQASMWTMVGLALACAYFCKTLPELVAGLIMGVAPGGGVGMMAAAAVASATAAIGAIATAVTAGAAAPVAAGGVAAASDGGAAATGGGGLAAAINSSITGGAGGASGAVIGGGAATGATARAAGATTKETTGAPGTAGGGTAVGDAATTQKAVRKAGDATASKTANEKASKTTSAAPNTRSSDAVATGNPNPAPTPEKLSDSDLKMAAAGLTRGAGIISAISVPGMEDAASLSLGLAPTQAGTDDTANSSKEVSDANNGAENNTVRGDGVAAPVASEGAARPTAQTSIDAPGDRSILRSLYVPGMEEKTS